MGRDRNQPRGYRASDLSPMRDRNEGYRTSRSPGGLRTSENPESSYQKPDYLADFERIRSNLSPLRDRNEPRGYRTSDLSPVRDQNEGYRTSRSPGDYRTSENPESSSQKPDYLADFER